MTKEVQKKLIWLGGILVCLLAGFFYWNFEAEEGIPEPETVHEQEEESSIESESESQTIWIYVHVSGAVHKPDQVYRLPEGSRVLDAILMAGGADEDAQLAALNLAVKLQDGQKIYVPSMEESYSIEENYQESTQNDLTDLNKADKIELDALPGIGPALAQRIIEYREEHGAFSCPEDLKNVKGIGDALFEKLRDRVTAG